ncbi:hypothetical protein BGZ67_010719 [Mortierella alpina]|nr:hypothetical protein BGZ67_010719 [Mortierella alpina]
MRLVQLGVSAGWFWPTISKTPISFSSHQQSDFVDKALCRLRPHSDGIHLVMDVPMTIEAFSEFLVQIYRTVTNYSDCVLQDKHNENETSSDLRRCFLKKDGITLNSSLADLRQTFETSGIPSNIKGILRIHLEFPNVTRPRPVTHVRRDPTTGFEDVMVYIDISNMDSYFDERVAGNAEDMAKLTRLIKFVCNSV